MEQCRKWCHRTWELFAEYDHNSESEVRIMQQTAFVVRACQLLGEIYLIDYHRGGRDDTLRDVLLWSERAMVQVSTARKKLNRRAAA